MSKEILVSLIPLAGLILSALASLLISRRVVAAESHKLLFEAKKVYDNKLLEARLATYPNLYTLLSKFIKGTRQQSIERSTLESFIAEVNEWDCTHAILFSTYAGKACHDLRHFLEDLLRENNETLIQSLSSQPVIRTLIGKIRKLELALKSDLGIYGVDDRAGGLKVIVRDRYDA
jgi:hypothetical protein